MGGDGKCKTYVHTGRISFHRCIYKFLDLSESNDFVKFPADLSACHTENRAIQEYVLAPGQLRVEAGSHFQETRYPAAQRYPARSRLSDARQDLEEGRLARAVLADYPEDF